MSEKRNRSLTSSLSRRVAHDGYRGPTSRRPPPPPPAPPPVARSAAAAGAPKSVTSKAAASPDKPRARP